MLVIICTWKSQRMGTSNLSLMLINWTWGCTTFHNFISMLKKNNQKLAGLWLAGEVVNHVGIYRSKAAEGLSAFQRRSCFGFVFVFLVISNAYFPHYCLNSSEFAIIIFRSRKCCLVFVMDSIDKKGGKQNMIPDQIIEVWLRLTSNDIVRLSRGFLKRISNCHVIHRRDISEKNLLLVDGI